MHPWNLSTIVTSSEALDDIVIFRPANVYLLGILTAALLPLAIMYAVRNQTFKATNDTRRRSELRNSKDPEKQYRKKIFLQRTRDCYGYVNSHIGHIDSWRAKEHPHLYSTENPDGDVYLDWAGAALPTVSLLQAIAQDTRVLGNPHSTGPSAYRTARAIEQTQKLLLDHFHANPGKYAGHERSAPPGTATDDLHPGYDVVFTSGATECCQMVSQYFAWNGCQSCQRASTFLTTQNCHTSVVGMRAPALAHGAKYACSPSFNVDDVLHLIETSLQDPCPQCIDMDMHNLLAVPLESNFDGTRFEFNTLKRKIRNKKPGGQTWYTMLDIAKAASTGHVDLCHLDADFYCISFYKLFGEPTGLGCLFIKRTSAGVLQNSQEAGILRNYFGGGSVDLLISMRDTTFPRTGLAALNNGTSHFRGISSVKHGFRCIGNLGGMNAIHRHTSCLADELDRTLRSLVHANGSKAIAVYGPTRDASSMVGPTVVFNIVRSDGTFVGFNEVSKLAALHRPPIQLRTGCFCNPGACQIALSISDDEMIDNFLSAGHKCGDHVDLINSRPTGAIRASFGKDSTWEDLDILISFLKRDFVDRSPSCLLNSMSHTDDQSVRTVLLSQIYIYPIKSCAGQRVKSWQFSAKYGKPLFDREFALVDAYGVALRLQGHPMMAHINPVINLDEMSMVVSAKGYGSIKLDLESRHAGMGGIKNVRVCGNECPASLFGNDMTASDWFSVVLGVRCWLAIHRSASVTTCKMKQSQGVAFANEHPVLLISEHAVDLLNNILVAKGEAQVSALNFRPNFVVRSFDKRNIKQWNHIEDDWKTLSVRGKDLGFDVVGACARCSMVDVDPISGKKGRTLQTLAAYRRNNGQINFGIFLARSTEPCDNKGGEDLLWLSEGDIFCANEQK